MMRYSFALLVGDVRYIINFGMKVSLTDRAIQYK